MGLELGLVDIGRTRMQLVEAASGVQMISRIMSSGGPCWQGSPCSPLDEPARKTVKNAVSKCWSQNVQRVSSVCLASTEIADSLWKARLCGLASSCLLHRYMHGLSVFSWGGCLYECLWLPTEGAEVNVFSELQLSWASGLVTSHLEQWC